jgi:hypothetical protein
MCSGGDDFDLLLLLVCTSDGVDLVAESIPEIVASESLLTRLGAEALTIGVGSSVSSVGSASCSGSCGCRCESAQMPPRCSLVRLLKNAMSSMFGRTTDSMICKLTGSARAGQRADGANSQSPSAWTRSCS